MKLLPFIRKSGFLGILKRYSRAGGNLLVGQIQSKKDFVLTMRRESASRRDLTDFSLRSTFNLRRKKRQVLSLSNIVFFISPDSKVDCQS